MASDRSCCYVLTGMRIDSDSDARACAEGAVEKRIGVVRALKQWLDTVTGSALKIIES